MAGLVDMRTTLILTITALVIAACGSGELAESPRGSQPCFREGSSLSLRPYEWDEVLALGRGTLPNITLPSDNGGLTFISAGVTGGDDAKGFVLNLSSFDRDRETVVLKYSPFPPCQTSSSLNGLTPGTAPTNIELRPVNQGEFTGYGTLLNLEYATLDFRVLWLDDSQTGQNERLVVAERWVAKTLGEPH